MDGRRSFTALGAGLSTFLLVAVAVTERLPFEFSAVIGLPVGLLAGAVVFGAVAARFRTLGPTARDAVSAYAAFGVSVICLLALRYVNAGPSRSLLSADIVAGSGLGLAAVVFVALRFRSRTGRTNPK